MKGGLEKEVFSWDQIRNKGVRAYPVEDINDGGGHGPHHRWGENHRGSTESTFGHWKRAGI